MHQTEYNKFGSDYFIDRVGNDPRRQLSFLHEKEYLEKLIPQKIFETGKILDIGCSTGEFLNAMKWGGEKHGVEISDFAKEKAITNGICFEYGVDKKSFFDIVIFRGTIQYLKNPFEYLEKVFDCLKSGGYVIFLATPNSNSIYYKLFKTLPFLEEALNYYIPSDISLSMNLKNLQYEIIDISYPYIKTPYCQFLSDHLQFLMKLTFNKNVKFPFWRSMIQVVAQKPR